MSNIYFIFSTTNLFPFFKQKPEFCNKSDQLEKDFIGQKLKWKEMFLISNQLKAMKIS